MYIELLFNDIEKLLKLEKWLIKNKVRYDYFDEENDDYFKDEYTITIYGLNEYDDGYIRCDKFYMEFYNNDKLCYIDVEKNGIASCRVGLN